MKMRWIIIVVVFLGVLSLTIFFGQIFEYIPKPDSYVVEYNGVEYRVRNEKSSAVNYSSKFQVLNTLYTGLAFAGLLVTILLQMKDAKDREDQHNNDLVEERNKYITVEFNRNFFFLFSLLRELEKESRDYVIKKSLTKDIKIGSFLNCIANFSLMRDKNIILMKWIIIDIGYRRFFEGYLNLVLFIKNSNIDNKKFYLETSVCSFAQDIKVLMYFLFEIYSHNDNLKSVRDFLEQEGVLNNCISFVSMGCLSSLTCFIEEFKNHNEYVNCELK